MQEANGSLLQSVNPLIKLAKEREELYFELFSFVNKHIESSSNDLDNLTIFNKFIAAIALKHLHLRSREQDFLIAMLETPAVELSVDVSIAKEVLRFSSRLIEILEASTAKIRKTVFDDCGRVGREFTRFKIMLNKILKRQPFNLKEYCEYIINFSSGKYLKQVSKLQKYVDKVEMGENIWLRELYTKDNSDHDPSSEDKKHIAEEIVPKKLNFKLDIKHIDPDHRKHSPKKTLKPSTKRRDRVKHKDKGLDMEREQEIKEKPSKEATANKLLKFYNLLELNKREFLEDYIYDQIQEETHKQKLLSQLLERNKQINSQINNFVKKNNSHYLSIPIINIPPPSKSSGDQRNDSLTNKMSLRTSFVISKRKASFHLESSTVEKFELPTSPRDEPPSTIKNINHRRKSSHSNHRQIDKSNKKMFVVKQPMVFEDQVIPQAQINQTQWLHVPISNRYKQRRNENIRLKKKNAPSPMDNAYLPNNFKYPF